MLIGSGSGYSVMAPLGTGLQEATGNWMKSRRLSLHEKRLIFRLFSAAALDGPENQPVRDGASARVCGIRDHCKILLKLRVPVTLHKLADPRRVQTDGRLRWRHLAGKQGIDLCEPCPN